MASSSGAGADSEGEEQEDPSSSLVYKTADAMEDLTLGTNDDNTSSKKEEEGLDELSEFRAQWQRELGGTPSPRRGPATPPARDQSKEGSEELSPAREPWERSLAVTPPPQREPPLADPLTDEEKAKQLFRQGEELESRGKMYEAIQHYKRAMQINPGIETLLYESAERSDTPEDEESEAEEVPRADGDEEDEEWVEGEDLLARLQRIQARKGLLCEPDNPEKECHFSWLPYEVVLLIIRWVVSAELDVGSLERLAAVCRGLFVACRDPDVWRAMCLRAWGAECGAPRAAGAGGAAGWRGMFVSRPRLLLHGCYISKTTYLRCGENSFQDQTYRPWFLVDYYRYLRFFSDGVVLMYTTPDEPVACVPQLKSRHRAAAGALAGHYRLQGDQVVIIVKKSSEKKPAQPTHTRFRSRRKETHEAHETTFRLELQIRSVRGRGSWQLAWRGYSVSTRREQWTQFELSPAKFPPFAFSRVRAYSALATAPL